MMHMDRETNDMTSSLSERERQLLLLAAQGLTDVAISHRLGISLATVGTYWGRVRIKLGPMNRTELVAKFLKEQATVAMAGLKSENQHLVDALQEQATAVEMLRTSLDMFRGLIETAPDAILLVSDDGSIVLANEQAEDMFGYAKNELNGLMIEKLVPARYHENHLEQRAEYISHPTKRRMGEHLATYARRKDGSEFLTSTALSATETKQGFLVTCIIRDLKIETNHE